MTKVKIAAAREFIREKNYDLAREILETIDDAEVKDLLKTLPPKKKRGGVGGLIRAFLIVAVVMLLIGAGGGAYLMASFGGGGIGGPPMADADIFGTATQVIAQVTETAEALDGSAEPADLTATALIQTATQMSVEAQAADADENLDSFQLTATAVVQQATAMVEEGAAQAESATPAPSAIEDRPEVVVAVVALGGYTGEVETTLRSDAIEVMWQQVNSPAEDTARVACILREAGLTDLTYRLAGTALGNDAFGNEAQARAFDVVLPPAVHAQIDCDDPASADIAALVDEDENALFNIYTEDE